MQKIGKLLISISGHNLAYHLNSARKVNRKSIVEFLVSQMKVKKFDLMLFCPPDDDLLGTLSVIGAAASGQVSHFLRGGTA